MRFGTEDITILSLPHFQIVHKWVPCHREVLKRSHVDKTILLLKIENRYVPIVESAVKIIDPEAEEANNEPPAIEAAPTAAYSKATDAASISLPSNSTTTNVENSDPLKVTSTSSNNQSAAAGHTNAAQVKEDTQPQKEAATNEKETLEEETTSTTTNTKTTEENHAL